ncbi:MAG: hypothetical protein A3A94_01115 [Candidatus Portnoybacteria bacterium RIFCSPLOWO2_01_FULL_43_11]|uniref:Xylose isomerase-like TIM barrel domain-containing protein n=3 Tax=Bacteria candidate phyla TaxID=1783234 RepID=A0A1G2FSQ7_9BACT|nr:MAG: hypothetical protein A2713_01750 [candidate division WWE3 bacterium RIFCSPHIGHO2_01_FULL_35_17]OGZ38109.1 MAG: hypothetical protein A3A94_01115 [Candidatus Portnoybacteria bacterium RIFCSPLOWO2_01_FULL_43_11]OGZ40847.1 MAG: hypothetical protein A3I20_02480 [Candidatus Portnoybacteria bacterium RIFCSPLOWO2_02_FULL_40_15]
MVELYVSWVKGLPQDKEALRILRENNLGVEMSNIDGQVEMVKDAGVKFSSHTPGLNLTLNLAKPNFIDVFDNEQGKRLLYVVKNSDAPVVSFHLGYSAEKIYKMANYPNVPDPETIIANRNYLLRIISTRLTILADLFGNFDKQVLIESLDYSRERPVLWEIEPKDGEAAANKELIQKVIREYGTNAGILYVTEPNFIKEVFKKCDYYYSESPIGFLFDVSHVFVSADAKIHNHKFLGVIEDYFQIILNAVGTRTKELHLSVPNDDGKNGYSHYHHKFTPGNYLNDWIIDITKIVFEQTKKFLQIIVLEFNTGLSPTEHVKLMLKQAEYVIKQLNPY